MRLIEVDVVIVGGGIAGGALATALARAGVDVLVIERSTQFSDRVRGESMMPWGVAEAEALGVADVLREAGAHTAPTWRRYSEGQIDPREIPVRLLVPGVGGTLNLRHPVACDALLAAAAEAGAHVLRGASVTSIDVATDRARVALDGADGEQWHITARLLVGADGRASQVRRALGLELERTEATAAIAGLLLDGVEGPDDHDVVVEHDHGMSLLLHQGHGVARAYHVVPAGELDRYAGPTGAARFLADLTACPPVADRLARARPAGPCAAVANVETWTDAPARDAAVLVGDAAGQSDPTVGCGLAVAMRDARIVRGIVLSGGRDASAFASYGAERDDRMRRLRRIAGTMVEAVVRPGPDRGERRAAFAEAMATFDPAVFPVVVGMFAGPETVPEALVTPS